MSNGNYICVKCGALNRAPVVRITALRQSEGKAVQEAEASSRWPQHCSQPMKLMTNVESQGATQLSQKERVNWVRKGMYVLRQHQHGKHKWKPVTADWQIEEAKQQRMVYFLKVEEQDDLLRRRKPVNIRKDRHLALE
jgi:hypothetical protein